MAGGRLGDSFVASISIPFSYYLLTYDMVCTVTASASQLLLHPLRSKHRCHVQPHTFATVTPSHNTCFAKSPLLRPIICSTHSGQSTGATCSHTRLYDSFTFSYTTCSLHRHHFCILSSPPLQSPRRP